MSSTPYSTAEQLKAALDQMHRIAAAAKKVTKNSKLPVKALAAMQSELYLAVNKLMSNCQAQAWPRLPDPQEARHTSAAISKFIRCVAKPWVATVATSNLWWTR